MQIREIAGGILLTLEPTPLPNSIADPIRERWCLGEEDDMADCLLDHAATIANPSTFLLPEKVTSVEGNCVTLGSHTFISSLVAQKLHSPGMTAVGYVATCGQALYHAHKDYADDFVASAIWDDICLAYLRMALDMLQKYVLQNIYPDKDGKKMYSALNPGSLSSWPIQAQKDLFGFLGEGTKLAGVELTPSMLMVPAKSSSGLLFPTDKPYENCMHCPRIDCPNRRAEYKGDD